MGLTIDQFWNLTPRETDSYIRAHQWREKREFERDLILAWHIEALHRTEKLPTVEKLLNPPKTKALSEQEAAERKRELEEMTDLFADKLNLER